MSERFESGFLNQTTTSLDNSSFGMNNFKPGSHVTQQSRGDKLRVQQSSIPAHHLEDLPKNLEQLPADLNQVRNVRNCYSLYDPTMFSSEMLNFSTNNDVLLAHKDVILDLQGSDAGRHGRSAGAEDVSFTYSSHSNSSNLNPSAKARDSQNASCDWIVNCVNGSASTGYNGYQDVQSSLINPSSESSSQNSQKQYVEMHFSSPSFHQNTLQEVVSSSTMGSHGFEMASLVQQNIRETGHGSWVDSGNELVLLPTYGNQSSASSLNNAATWVHKPIEGSHQLSGELNFVANKSERDLSAVASDSRVQGLSLSLSSHLPSEIHVAQISGNFGSEDLQSRTGTFIGPQDSKHNKPGYVCSNSKSSVGNNGYGNPIQNTVGFSMNSHQNTGPHGPFTGYATILKSSKFLKPAQRLLDDICGVTSPKFVKTCEISERGSGDVSISGDTVNAENEIGGKDGNSGASSCTFYSSNEALGDGGVGSGSCESNQLEYQQKKAKLLYMQDEACRRYKLYHQQMQMVVSSFESVAGLSNSSPYTSLALKTASRQFRCLKSAISDQLRQVSKALGEDLSSPTTGTSSNKGDTTTPRLNFIDQSFWQHKPGEESLGFLEPQRHVWKPQRGLPDRSVAVLRAWLFEHFLHPYPTDTDKHMLATQTGLSRNQVSNWFINARVRIWKPMVEEIHKLETQGSAKMDLDSSNNGRKPTSDSGSGPTGDDQSSNKLTVDTMSCPGAGSRTNAEGGQCAKQWNIQEKRSRVESQIPTPLDSSFMDFVPHHQSQSGVEVEWLGAVSLTLGLRHNTETQQQQQPQQQQQQQEHQLRHLGGQIIHDLAD
ncbi:hypothetical protein HHK36_018176 [Tetracentron sinense]|uniref:Homeobox domain-containing protein n=1 Tax=Tetracentron sinense TaxID=13715 RepID=A0A834YYA9_TETSI|nr:hypothetical protein HHK36_018176 [Tetracentron sinense]